MKPRKRSKLCARKKPEQRIFTYDCETDPFDSGREISPFLWGCYDGNGYFEFTDTNDFIEFAKNEKAIFYAHNGGKFDAQFFIDKITPGQKIMVINGRLSEFKIGLATFRDSYNIMPCKLEAYKKDKIDYSKFTKENRKKHWQEIAEYLKADCVYLWEMVTRYRKQYGTGLTLAGCAMKLYRRDYAFGTSLKKFTQNGYSGRDFFDKLHPYYYGGRCQAFQKGKLSGNFVYYDINSAYPFAMTHPQPHGYKFRTVAKLNGKPGTSFVSLECQSAGCFPFREKNGNLSFPHGRNIYHVSDWEYYTAKKYNLISDVKILKVIQFKDWIRFDKYVQHFFELKAANKAKETSDQKFNYLMAKLFMNSLYGKFAANPRKYKNCRVADFASIDFSNFIGTIGKGFAIEETPLEPAAETFYNLGTAAAITGFVRAALMAAIAKSAEVAYCDTDSLICREFGGDVGPALGQWSLECRARRVWIGGKKIYCVETDKGETKTACKGVHATPAEIRRVCEGATVEITQDAPCIRYGNQSALTRKIRMT